MPDQNQPYKKQGLHGTLLLAITGGVACGKSTAGPVFERTGFRVQDADRIAHHLLRPGKEVFQQVVQTFGKQILNAEGQVARKVLAEKVFSDPEALKKLNALVHPAVMERVEELKADARAGGFPLAVQVPLLFEANMADGWDAVLCITAPEPVVLERLKARGLSRAEAGRRIQAQMPLTEKAKRSDYVIENDSTREVFEEKVYAAACRMLEERSR
jgi:dephospho-CoA kinase